MPVHIDYNDPQYAESAAEILRRHDNAGPEANITSAVRDFPDRYRDWPGPARSSRRTRPPRDRAALWTSPPSTPSSSSSAGSAPTADSTPTPTMYEQIDDYLSQSEKPGPPAHGHPDRRQVLAAALAQRWPCQSDPAIRIHAGRPRPLDHTLRMAPRSRPLCRGEHPALAHRHRRALRP